MKIVVTKSNILIQIKNRNFSNIIEKVFSFLLSPYAVVLLALYLSVFSTYYFYTKDLILAYGDAESHLAIAKRVIHSLTPGAAQLGGIWLPLPHILLVPFVYFDFLWKTGLAGSIVSGFFYILSALFIYKLVLLLTKSNGASFVGGLVFLLNPNIFYLQATPMTELILIAFFTISNYFFVKFILNYKDYTSLIYAAFFGFLATLSRYDGWFLVFIQFLTIPIIFLLKKGVDYTTFKANLKKEYKSLIGMLTLYGTLAFFGIFLWLLWDYLILGDPFYFTNSMFSARSQQIGWFNKGQLPAYKNIALSVAYYFETTLQNTGVFVYALAFIGLIYFLHQRRRNLAIATIISIPFIFYVVALYLGQSVIFIPTLTPTDFEWKLFNVRYGVMLIPAVAIFFAFLFSKSHEILKIVYLAALFFQMYLFISGHTTVISLQDGLGGLSAAKHPDVEKFLQNNYKNGTVLLDDYSRTMSVIKSGINERDTIYIGNKPYWEISLINPEKHADWIIMQQGDMVWTSLYANKNGQDHLYKYYKKVYTSDEILVFKKIE